MSSPVACLTCSCALTRSTVRIRNEKGSFLMTWLFPLVAPCSFALEWNHLILKPSNTVHCLAPSLRSGDRARPQCSQGAPGGTAVPTRSPSTAVSLLCVGNSLNSKPSVQGARCPSESSLLCVLQARAARGMEPRG